MKKKVDLSAKLARITSKKTQKTGNKHKFGGRNNGPARQKYWALHTLREHKVKALMLMGMTRAEATVYWEQARGGRRMRDR